MQEKTVRKIIISSFLVFLVGMTYIIAYPYIFGEHWISSSNIFKFKDVTGPVAVSKIVNAPPARWQDYKQGTSSRLAILLTDTNSAWLGLVHGLKTIGVPFRITTDIDEALKHKVVLVYPLISGKVLTSPQLKKISGYARTGGNIIGVNVLGGGLQSIFGFKSVEPSRIHTRVLLQKSHPVIHDLVDDDFRSIRLSTEDVNDLNFGTHIYHEPKHLPLALYNDGSPAMVYNIFSHSETYAIGFDIGFYLLKAYNRRMENVSDTYVNGFESSVDNILRLIKNIYRRHEPLALTLGTVPYNYSLSVILTHDIDYNRSLENALVYARHESTEKISATHFIQTKYISDWNDRIFFDDKNLFNFKKLQALNVELGSHSVSHSLLFHEFVPGNGAEQYPDYSPFVKDEAETYNGTVLGELRVSKFLIEYFADDYNVVSFRPGHLSNPLSLSQSLQATDYRYSSSVTANVSLTHLPFKLNHNRDIASETNIFEFPITVEDELPPKMGERIDDAIALAHKISRYGGIFVVLIHPDILGHKLEFQTQFVEAMKPIAWFGSLRQFGDWWSVRDQVLIDVEKRSNKYYVMLDIPAKVDGLVLNVPDAWRLLKVDLQGVQATQKGGQVTIDSTKGKVKLVFK